MDPKLYLTDPGIYKNNQGYRYHSNDKLVTDPKTLTRLNGLVVPPAWKSVWYSSNPDCHILVHGIDQGGKKQYILSPEWIASQNNSKFKRMKTFVRKIPAFKRLISLDQFTTTGSVWDFNNKQNLIYLLFNLLLDTHIRVGNEIYADNNKTYGLTTLRQKHLTCTNHCYQFSFVGKSNQKHQIEVPKKYKWIISQFITNKKADPLFYFYQSPVKIKQTISSEELNNQLKAYIGDEYTCKDFRTYSANVIFIKSFLTNAKKSEKGTPLLNNIILDSINESAKQLGHTKTISKKNYISNKLIDFIIDYPTVAVQSSSSALLSRVWS